jgi:hypothetical protein
LLFGVFFLRGSFEFPGLVLFKEVLPFLKEGFEVIIDFIKDEFNLSFGFNFYDLNT